MVVSVVYSHMSILGWGHKEQFKENRHLVNGMDVTILTSLNETNVHCYLSMEYLRNW